MIHPIFLEGYQTGMLPRRGLGVRLGGELRIAARSSCVSFESFNRRKYARSAMPSNGFAIVSPSLNQCLVQFSWSFSVTQVFPPYQIAVCLVVLEVRLGSQYNPITEPLVLSRLLYDIWQRRVRLLCATCSCRVNFKNHRKERYLMNDPTRMIQIVQTTVEAISSLLTQAGATSNGAQRTILYLLAARI